MPPQSRLTWGFKIRTSGLSEDGRPRSSGKCLRPRLFSVPKVKNENPGEWRGVEIQSDYCDVNAGKQRCRVLTKYNPKTTMVTCIRSHSNKRWSEPPIEAKNTPFLQPKEESWFAKQVHTKIIHLLVFPTESEDISVLCSGQVLP